MYRGCAANAGTKAVPGAALLMIAKAVVAPGESQREIPFRLENDFFLSFVAIKKIDWIAGQIIAVLRFRWSYTVSRNTVPGIIGWALFFTEAAVNAISGWRLTIWDFFTLDIIRSNFLPTCLNISIFTRIFMRSNKRAYVRPDHFSISWINKLHFDFHVISF
ncbi:hypothetical protein [Microbulbifer sp. TYP-18]|uniref:hypothetical protein n=1 Tax=Microbulbifer sp. TYP-18 TaxID=3230024 RepID=UPI0034C66965